LVLRLRGGARGVFQVDEKFVQRNLEGVVTREDSELMNLFIEQSLGKSENGDIDEAIEPLDGKPTSVLGAYYRLGPLPRRSCDTSPLEELEFFSSRTALPRDKAFNLPGGKGARLVEVEHSILFGADATKLTNVYKRDDNRGAFMSALRRMRLA